MNQEHRIYLLRVINLLQQALNEARGDPELFPSGLLREAMTKLAWLRAQGP